MLRFLLDYSLAIISLILLAIGILIPRTKKQWSLLSKGFLYFLGFVLFVSTLMFEYFTEKNIGKIITKSIGDGFCYLVTIDECPPEIKQKVENRKIDKPRNNTAKDKIENTKRVLDKLKIEMQEIEMQEIKTESTKHIE